MLFPNPFQNGLYASNITKFPFESDSSYDSACFRNFPIASRIDPAPLSLPSPPQNLSNISSCCFKSGHFSIPPPCSCTSCSSRWFVSFCFLHVSSSFEENSIRSSFRAISNFFVSRRISSLKASNFPSLSLSSSRSLTTGPHR